MSFIEGHKAVRAAARDTAAYSSDLMGDRDVRTYKQLPLEIDPPKHHQYRTALSPLFVKSSVEQHVDEFRAIAKELITGFAAAGGGEVTSLALDMVTRCLGVLYGRPQDVEEWRSWGRDTWMYTEHGRTGAHLDEYLSRTFDEVEAHPGADAFTLISRIEIDGQRISRTEAMGVANVLLAGGRDTVVKLMTGCIWHFGVSPEDRQYIRENPSEVSTAISEILRFLTPLPAMERIPQDKLSTPHELRTDDSYVRLSFVSGNFDESVFTEPHKINIRRERNAHLSFGFGPHTCVGNHVAEIETRVFLEEWLETVPAWSILPTSRIEYSRVGSTEFLGNFESLVVDIPRT